MKSLKIKKHKIFILLLVVSFLYFSNYILIRDFGRNTNSNNSLYTENQKIKTAYWDLSGVEIEIDEFVPSKSWNIYANNPSYPWCTGAGTELDPYVIQDLYMDQYSTYWYDCIRIRNSIAYFQIINCVLINSNTPLLLDNVTNGKIFNNNCSMSYYGIHLLDSSNNIISGNFISFNYEYELSLENSHYNLIFNNYFKSWGYNGIIIDGYNNEIQNNEIYDHYSNGISISGNGNTITENIISNNYQSAITIGYNANNNTISNNTISYNGNAIYIGSCEENKIFENTIIRNGLQIDGAADLYVADNIFRNSTVTLASGSDINFTRNYLYNCGLTLGWYLEWYPDQIPNCSIDSTNLVNNKPLYFYVNKVGLVPNDFNNAGQVILINCNESRAENLNLSYTFTGLRLVKCFRNEFNGIYASFNSNYGIHLDYSNNTTISGSIIRNNTLSGVYLENSHDNNIIDNEVYKNAIGITCYGVLNNRITENTIFENNGIGLHIDYCFNHTITGNNVHDNIDYGIYISGGANHTINGNSVSGHKTIIYHEGGYGFWVDQYGIFLEDSSYNNITHNLLDDNEVGLRLDTSDHNKVTQNSGNNWDTLISLSTSDWNEILFNNGTNGGMSLDYSHYNHIKSNIFKNLHFHGIDLMNSDFNLITHNNIQGERIAGFSLYNSNYNNISYNYIRTCGVCFSEGDECIGNIFESNICEEVDCYGIPGYTFWILIAIFLIASVFSLIQIKKNLKF